MCKVDRSTNSGASVPVAAYLNDAFWELARIWVGRVLLLLGLAFLAGYAAARIEGWAGERTFLRSLGAMKSPGAPGLAGHAGIADESATSSKPHQVQAGTPLAVLKIPRLNLVAPLLEGTDFLTLNHGLGRIRGTASPGGRGNIGIAGHRDGIFRELRNVKKGDVIVLETQRGKDTYIADQLRIVTPDDVSVLRPRLAPSLTLVTCYPFYFVGSAPKRFIVQASLSQSTSNGHPGMDVHTAFTTQVTPKEKQ